MDHFEGGTSIVDREGYNSSETTLDVTSFSHGNVNFVLSSPAVLFVGDGATPSRFALEQNYPNPFNPTTTISFWTPVVAPVSLTVYNMIGQEVARLVHEVMPAGNHSVTWSGEGLPSGVYLYRLIGSGITETRKMVLMK